MPIASRIRILWALGFSLAVHALLLSLNTGGTGLGWTGHEPKRRVTIRLASRFVPRVNEAQPPEREEKIPAPSRPRPMKPVAEPPRFAAPVVPEVARVVRELPPPVDAGRDGGVKSETMPEAGESGSSGSEPTPEADAVSGGKAGEVVLARPLYRENPPPAYPSLARRRGWQGTVILEALVTVEGRVKEIVVSQSSGHRVLDDAALDAVRGWRFTPGRRGDEAVSMRVLVPVRFGLE